MRELQQNLTKIALAGIALTALYDILAINKGQSAIGVGKVFTGWYGGLLARGSGQKPPPGF
jgi:hypothetical protein